MNTQSGQIEAPVATAADSNRSASKLAAPLPKATRRTPKRPPVAVEGSGSPTNIPGEERMPGKATKTTKTKPASPPSRLQQGRLFPEDDMATAAIKAAEVPKLPPGELVPEVSLAPTSPTAETDAGGVSPVNPDHPRETLPTRPTISVPGPGADSASDGASVDAAPVVVPPKPTEEGDAVSERNKQEFRERDARIVLAARVHDQPEFWFITAGRDLDEMERKKLYRIEKFTTLEEYHRQRGLLT